MDCLGEGKIDKDRAKVGIPLSDEFRMGLEKREKTVNHSGRFRNNFGVNKEAIFPGQKDRRRDERNWMATFTKSGCIACRD